MWIPKSEEEIITVISNGHLEETASFDGKAQISASSTEIAKDIAAMTTDGGVIIYGIGEDENERLTLLTPIELAGQPERIASIARTAISEPPTVHIHIIPKSDDPATGYIVLEIPPSPRAPHMVTVGKKNRYYGRTSKTNYPLSEGEVARLYARRQQMEVDRDAILQQEIERYPYQPNDKLAYLYAFIRPVYRQPDDLVDRMRQESESKMDMYLRLTRYVAQKNFVRSPYSLSLDEAYQWRPTTDGYLGDNIRNDNGLHNLIRLEVDHNGKGHLFCGRAARIEKLYDEKRFTFSPFLVAGNIASFFNLFGYIYNQVEYHGLVDIGVALIGLQGSVPYLPYSRMLDNLPYEHNEYRRTARCSANELLHETQTIAAKIIMPLMNAMTRERFNPFPS